MLIIRLILKVTSWIALVVGLVWSGKVTADDFKGAPKVVVAPVILDLDTAQTFTQSVSNEGEIPAWIALGGLSGRALENAPLILSDLKSDYDTMVLEIAYGLESTSPAQQQKWQTKVSEMAFTSGGSLFKEDNPLLFLGHETLSFEKPGNYKFSARFIDPSNNQSDQEIFEEFDFHLVLGNQSEDIQIFTAEDSHPGLLLLAGMFGVFIHLFLVVIHFIVPLQDAIALDEIEI